MIFKEEIKMAFKIDDIIIDSIDTALATDFNDVPLYTLTQLTDATIDISGESTDAVDKNGTLIKRVWKGKTGTFTATNAMVNLNIIGAMSSTEGYKVATADAPIEMPKIFTVKNDGTKVTLPDYDKTTSTVQVAAQGNNGAMGVTYTQGTAAAADKFAVADNGVVTFPTDSTAEKFVVLYKRKVKSGVAITNRADKFPGTVRLYVKALAYDPCTADTLRAVMIYLPSFQVSPEVSISLSADGTIDYSGDLQVDYCGADKTLYEIFAIDEGEEDIFA